MKKIDEDDIKIVVKEKMIDKDDGNESERKSGREIQRQRIGQRAAIQSRAMVMVMIEDGLPLIDGKNPIIDGLSVNDDDTSLYNTNSNQEANR